MTNICFLDTECLGLDRMAPVWEFACIRVDQSGNEIARDHFQARHDVAFWMESGDYGSTTFADDYQARYDESTALWEHEAAKRVHAITDGGAYIAGSNPAFDMERLTIMLQRNGITPGWHYHPLDVPTLAHGFLCGRGEPPALPWKSDLLSKAAGVDPADYARHTAMGDCEWSRDLYRAVTGGAS